MEQENNMNLQIRKPSKKTKRTKPVKVVYISNPMKIKTSPSQFRALVQELTGRDAEFPDPAKFSVPTATVDDDDGDSTAEIEGRDLDDNSNNNNKNNNNNNNNSIHNNLNGTQVVMMSERLEQSSGGSSNSSSSSTATVSASPKNNPYDMFNGDDVLFMMEGFSGISPTSVWYETIHPVV